MTENEKMELTKMNMRLVRANYRHLQSEYEAASASRGAVTAWGSLGGRSNRVSRPTQQCALSQIELDAQRDRMNGWFESIRATYFRLIERGNKSVNLWRHERLVARAIQLYVFEKADTAMMTTLLSGPKALSRQYVSGILKEGVREIMADAEGAGLFGASTSLRHIGG